MPGSERDAPPRVPVNGASSGCSITERFEARASARPDALAVRAADATLTYGELEQQSNRLAHRLRALGVDRETMVGLCLPRSAALVVGALGILKAGGVYVALDPGQPADRLGFMLADCGAGVIVGDGTTPARCGEVTATQVAVDASERDAEAAQPPEVLSTPEDLAYVIYTSGSTGRPKGVLVTHAGLENLVDWHRRAFGIGEADRGSQVANPAFDAAVWELWPYLTSGASLHVCADEVRADPEAIRDWLVAEEITVTFLPTVLAEAVIALHWPSELRLRHLLTGGDALHARPPAGLPFAVVNNYGPSEGSVVATSGVVASGESGQPTIGWPIDNVRIHIVDDALAEVPAGATGELLIGGPSVARGYLGRPELTAEAFIPDPFSPGSGARLYRTGDYVRRLPDGALEFRGRRDEQVQIRGNRVEPGEISATLLRHPAVRAAVVVVDERASAEPRLIAHVVADAPRPDSEALRAHLGRSLPGHMIPAAFVYLDALPVTDNGKVDRTRLPIPTAANSAAPADSARPDGELERTLEAIVCELLELDRVGVDENFFMLGGHSLLGAQLVTRIDERFGVAMSLRALFDNPTVAEMAVEVQRLLVADLEAMSDADAARLLARAPTAAAEPAQPHA
jgi:amino acid adenylation domain-containing protein